MSEWFDLINASGTVIGYAERAVCHHNPGLLHQAVHVQVLNGNRELYLQKRSVSKDIQPGKWDSSVGGHLMPGESPYDGARRELEEELGVQAAILEPAYEYLWESECESEKITTFVVRHEGPFHLDPIEISEGRFWSMADIRNQIRNSHFTPQFELEFRFLTQWLGDES